MNNRLAVHIIDTVANLPDEKNAISLCQRKVVGNDSLEKLAARDTEIGYQFFFMSTECFASKAAAKQPQSTLTMELTA